MINTLTNTGYGIKINYGASSNPAHVFRELADIVSSLQEINRHLLLSIDLDIEPVILLENIEQGSVIVWLKDTLKALDDKDVEELNFKRIVGVFLNRARYAIIAFTNKNKQLDNKEQVEQLQQELIKIAEESELKVLPVYSAIDARVLLSDIGDLQDSLSSLSGEDLASYLTTESEISFNKEFNFTPEVVEEILTKETIKSQSEMILKVKKPDYLGESKWEFKYENRKLEAKIKDANWLSNYQNGKIDIRPGSSLRVSMNIIVKYDYENEVISTQYEILEIIKIIPPTLYAQTELPPYS